MKKSGKQQALSPEDGNAPRMLGLLKGMAAAYALTCIVFIAYAILLTFTDLSEEHIPLVALLCTAVSAAIAGFDWARVASGRGILWGILAGVVYALLLFFLAAFGGGGFAFGANRWIMLLVAAAGGGIGGVFGINLQQH